MLPTSREYGIVLRGDPVSGASLLSTTIQTAMLLGRVLDNEPGIYGSVIFAFTDDLDVINRLHDNLRDAEGEDPRGLAGGQILADLRSPDGPQADARYREGQSWDLPAHLRAHVPETEGRAYFVSGHRRRQRGGCHRCDVLVRGRIQRSEGRRGHPAQGASGHGLIPAAAGSCGSSLAMRPITAVVLSEYGRDRIAYQTYEKLLDPEIGARSLPIGNRFVIKIQATHALIDWIDSSNECRWTVGIAAAEQGERATTGPPRSLSLLRSLLGSVDLQSELAEYLRRSLMISADEAEAALREEPRSLLLSVVPTALRRLESNWTPLGRGN